MLRATDMSFYIPEIEAYCNGIASEPVLSEKDADFITAENRLTTWIRSLKSDTVILFS